MQIFFKTPSNNHITLEVEPTDRIEDIRVRILEEEGLAPADCHLVFAGKVLQDGNTLQDYSVQKDSTLFIVLHTYDDCTDAVCNAEDCGYTREAKTAHIYTDCTDSDCNNEGCTVTREASLAHSFSGCTDTSCDNIGCPFVREAYASHDIDSCLDTACGREGCPFVKEAKEHEGGFASCTNRTVCDDCGSEYGELAAHEENAEEWIVTDTHHYHRCKYWSEITSCKEKYEYSEHTYGEWTVTKEADVLIEGEMERSCVCGAKDYDTIPAKSMFEKSITTTDIIVVVAVVVAVIIICAVAWYIKKP